MTDYTDVIVAAKYLESKARAIRRLVESTAAFQVKDFLNLTQMLKDIQAVDLDALKESIIGSAKTRADLVAEARRRGIRYVAELSKDDLIQALLVYEEVGEPNE